MIDLEDGVFGFLLLQLPVELLVLDARKNDRTCITVVQIDIIPFAHGELLLVLFGRPRSFVGGTSTERKSMHF
jgi:hypothetical protein